MNSSNCQTCVLLRRLNLKFWKCHDCGLTASSLPVGKFKDEDEYDDAVPFVGLLPIAYNYVDVSTQTESATAIYGDFETFVSQDNEEEVEEDDDIIICDVCQSELNDEQNFGACMCGRVNSSCGEPCLVWDEEEGEYLCPDCHEVDLDEN